MRTATIIGSGITGPAAALYLNKAGWDVNVIEARQPGELRSSGILGITETNWVALDRAGVDLSAELVNEYTDDNQGVTFISPYRYITWTDLHLALTEAAQQQTGVTFEYGRYVEHEPDTDLVVHATGVGAAHEVSDPVYTGWVLVRGTAPMSINSAWSRYYGVGACGRYMAVGGDTPYGAAMELFIQRDWRGPVTMHTTRRPSEIRDMPQGWRIAFESVPEFMVSPMSDWPVPPHLRRLDGGRVVLRMGDANGQLRPQTSMGANLALGEAQAASLLTTPLAEPLESVLLLKRQTEYDNGIRFGV